MRTYKTGLLLFLMCLSVPAFAADWKLRMDGIGPLRIGMRLDEVSRRVGSALDRTDPALQATKGCEQVGLRSHPGVALMFIDDVLKRVDVFKGATQTDRGTRVGDAVARVLLAYPGIAREKNFYDDTEQYLTARSADSTLAIRFTTYQGKIDSFYAGSIEQVRYVEGCL